jgi:hypothetical protein
MHLPAPHVCDSIDKQRLAIPRDSAQKHPMITMDALPGLWRRSLLAWADGRRDTTTRVHWLQGPSLYADLRQPEARPSFAGVTGFDDLDTTQIAWMARQEAFAGRLARQASSSNGTGPSISSRPPRCPMPGASGWKTA